MRHPMPLLLLAALGVLAASGCHRAADAATEAAIERASGQQVDIDRDGGRMRITTGDGEALITAGAGVALPADFPDDLFLPSSYGVTSVMDVGDARLVSLESDGAVASMFEDARAAMAGKGWSQMLAMQQADSAMLGFSQGGREATYTFTRHADGPVLLGIQLRGDPRQ
ncbi:hypothetical protein GCM10007164_23030 [Luteimonas padinae]|nr:hypothetical protein GCM10007164_23030 [Luteimonas padinae]